MNVYNVFMGVVFVVKVVEKVVEKVDKLIKVFMVYIDKKFVVVLVWFVFVVVNIFFKF